MKIGAQLYTVRDFTQNSKDFAETIKKVAAIGYETVQVSGVSQDISAAEIAEVCKANNVQIVLTHVPPDSLRKDVQAVIKNHEIMGCKYIGIGGVPGHAHTKEGFSDFIKEFTPIAKAIKDAGKQFMYHNHSYEFFRCDGKTGMDYLADNFPDAGFTIDTYWVQAGGSDPAYWIKKLAGRVDCIHLKDYVIVDGQPRMAEILEGNLNWDAIFDAAKAAGVKYALVEQDDAYVGDPFECLNTSFKNLKKRGLA